MASKAHSFVAPTDAELLQAQADLWRHSLRYLISMALKCAVELGIPTAIYNLGGAASVPDLVTALSLPQAKLPFLHRLMRLLASSGAFAQLVDDASRKAIYSITPLSYLFVDGGVTADGRHMSHAPFLFTTTSAHYIDTAMAMASWFKEDGEAPTFEHVHGASLFEESMRRAHPEFHRISMDALVVHDNFGVDIALRELSDIYGGIKSLTDCCYHGDGTTAKAIVKAFPQIRCTVLDLPEVIQTIPADGVVNYVGGDMFKFIPPAQVVLLKMVLHHWSDEDCVKILTQCRKAIPSREEGGKVLIGDIVLDPASSGPLFESHLLMDVCMMLMKGGGRQRDENDWRDIFMKAGFSDYKLVRKFGARGVLEAYP